MAIALTFFATACSGAVGGFGPNPQGSPSDASDNFPILLDASTADRTVEPVNDPGPSRGEASIETSTGVDVAPPPPGPCAGYAVCDDFESTAIGSPPAAPLWSAPSATSSKCSSAAGGPAVDDTQAHSGAHSVKITAGPAYCDHVLFANTTAFAANGAAAGGQVYSRFYVRLAGASDAVPPNAFGPAHSSFLVATDSEYGQSTHLRLGGWSGVLAWNREQDDKTLPAGVQAGPDSSDGGLEAPANTWLCVEVHIDESTGGVEAWIGDAPVSSLTAMPQDSGATSAPEDPWLLGAPHPVLSDLEFGWESYGGQASGTVWVDDVVIDKARIGCAPPGTDW